MERTERAAVISGGVCAVFAVLLLSMAALVHSVTFFAAAMLVVSRTVTGFLVAAGLRLSRKHTGTFTSGLYKLENLIVTVIGILVLFGAYQLGRLVIFRLRAGEPLMTGAEYAVPSLLVAVVLGLALGAFKNRVGKSENCPSLRADARHSYIDAAAMAAIALGVGLTALGVRGADCVAAFLTACMVFWDGGRIILDGIRVLLDASIERSLLDEVERIVRRDPRIRDIAAIGGRNSGSRRFFFLKLVPARRDVKALAAVTEELKQRICSDIKNADEVSIEYAAKDEGRLSIAVPLTRDGGYSSAGLAGAAGFAILDVDTGTGKIIHRRDASNPGQGTDLRGMIGAAVQLGREGVEALILPGPPEKDVGHTLDAYGIKLFLVPLSENKTDMNILFSQALRGTAGGNGGRP